MRTTILMLAAAVALTGCATGERVQDGDRVVSTGAERDPNDPMRSGDCGDAFQAIADAEGAGAITQVDMAVQICNSLEDWDRAAEAHPDALGDRDPREVLAERCAADTQTGTPICEELDAG